MRAAIWIGLLIGVGWAPAFAWPAQMKDTAPATQADKGSAGVSPQSLQAALDAALAKGQTEKAREILAELLRRPRLESDVLLQAGVKLAQLELYVEASQAFARCVQDYPELFEGHCNLALAELALGKFPEALAAIEKAPDISKQQEVAGLYLRGKIEDAMGKTREAEQDLSAAFAQAPQEENYALDLGLFYLRQRVYQKASEVFERGAAFQTSSPFLLLGLSLGRYLGGHPAEAVETCRRILQAQPDFSPARVLMAFALYVDGKFEEAEKVTAAGLGAPHPFPYLYYIHAATLLKLQSKEYERMLGDLALATRAIASCSLCYLTQSKVHQAMGDAVAAITDLEKAVTLDPAFPEAW